MESAFFFLMIVSNFLSRTGHEDHLAGSPKDDHANPVRQGLKKNSKPKGEIYVEQK
jgi:hypothetical protein